MAAAAAIAGRNMALKMKKKQHSQGSKKVFIEAKDAKTECRPPSVKAPQDVPYWLKPYATFAEQCDLVVQNSAFNWFIIACICIAGVLVGVQTFPALENQTWVVALDTFLLIVFTFEVCTKFFACGTQPLNFLRGPEKFWNIFDTVVVLLSMPFMKQFFAASGLLRLVRLLRLMKLIKKIPQLRIIVMGLIGGLKSILYIMLLLALVFYLYAIVGIELFRENDPFHFGSLHMAMVTLFRMATLEDWTDVMYINIFGCASRDYDDGGIYTLLLEDAVQNNEGVPILCDASASIKNPFAVFYFVTFIIISALVMLSLFVGAVTMSMAESMSQMKVEVEEAARQKVLNKAMKNSERERTFSQVIISASPSGLNNPSLKRSFSTVDSNRGSKDFKLKPLVEKVIEENTELGKKPSVLDRFKFASITSKSLRRVRSALTGPLASFKNVFYGEDDDLLLEKRELQMTFKKAWEGIDLRLEEEAFDVDAVISDQTFVMNVIDRVSKNAFFISESSWFKTFILVVICLAGVTVGIQTYISSTVLDLVDMFILVTFSVELLLKVLAEKFKPWQVFIKRKVILKWNVFDAIVVIGSFLPGSGSMLTILRLLRLLRVLKLVKSLPALQIIVVALLKGINSINYIGLIMLLVFYVFAIIGIILFRQNDPWHFGDLGTAVLTLFRAATLEDWTDIMYINMFGCDRYGYAEISFHCSDPVAQPLIAAIYFIFFSLIGALVLMTLFIGVVTTSMEEATEQQQNERLMDDQVLHIQAAHQLSDSEIIVYKKVFGMLDVDSSGAIDRDELRLGLTSIGRDITDWELTSMLRRVDTDGDGEVDLAEFIRFMMLIKQANNLPEQRESESTQ